MATATTSGVHSDPLIWDVGSVPVAPEPIVIPAGVTVTQNGAWDVGDGVTAVTIDAGSELIVNGLFEYRGNINLNGTMTLHDSAELVATAGNWQLTQGSGSVWRNVRTGGARPVLRADVGQYWLWRDSSLFTDAVINIDEVEFYNCGTNAVTGMLQRGHNTAALNIQMNNFLWHSCGQMRLGVGVTHHVDAVCLVDGIVIVNALSSQCLNYAANFPASWVAGSRYLRNIYVAGDVSVPSIVTTRKNAASNPPFEVSFGCLIDSNYSDFGGGYVYVSGPMIMDTYTGSGSELIFTANDGTFLVDGFMIYADRYNAHIIGLSEVSPLAEQALVTNSLIEFDAAGGPNFLPHKNGGVKFSSSLIINGNPFYTTAANSVGVSDYEYCTHVILADGEGQPSIIQETNAALVTYSVNGRSNIRVDLRSSPSLDFAEVLPQSGQSLFVDQFDLLDFNCHYIPAQVAAFNPYPTVTITGLSYGDPGFGGNDLFVDPQFQYAPRRMADYDALHGGTGTARNLYYEMFKASGYDRFGDPAVVNPAYSDFRVIKSWVEAAYVPTNPALQGAAHDGGDVGAFSVISEYIVGVLDTISATDGLLPAAAMSVVDAAAVSDNSITMTVSLSMSDLGSGADLSSISVFTDVIEAAMASDDATISVSLSLLDVGSGADLFDIISAYIVTVSDAVNATDSSIDMSVSLSMVDVGAGVDLSSAVTVALAVIEQSGGVDVAVNHDSVSRITQIKFVLKGRSVSIRMS